MKKVILVALVAMLASSASAGLLVYEGFEYEFGKPASWYADAIVGQSGGTGWTGSWTATARDMGIGAGLSYANLLSVGGAAYADVAVTGAGWGNGTGNDGNHAWDGMSRDFADIAQTDGTSVWISYLFNDNGPTATFGKWLGVKFPANPTYFGLAGGGGIYNGGLTGNLGSTTPSTNVTHLLVMQLEYEVATTNMTQRVWIDPTLSGAAAPAGAASMTGYGEQAGVNSILFDNTHQGQMDELRIGNTFADVTPIPEPASILLLVSGLVGAYKLRRRS